MGQKIVGHGPDDDYEALIPHTHIDQERDDEEQADVGADLFEEQQQRDEDIAADHDPVLQGVIAKGPPAEGLHLHGVVAVPGDEKLGGIGEADDQASEDDGFGHAFQHLIGDDLLVAEDHPQGNHQGDHHGQARVDGTGHEVGGEDGRVPAGNHAQGEVPGDHAVHRDDQGRGQGGEKKVAAGVMAPDFEFAVPAQGQHREDLAPYADGAVADDRQIGQHAGVPEEAAHGQVGGDGHHVEHQRRLEVGPQGALVGKGQHVENHPDPAQVDEGKQPGGAHGEDGHGLGGPGDGVAPAGPKEVQDGRDQGSRMGDTDPEHEIDQVGAPVHGVVLAAHANAHQDLNHPAGGAHEHPGEENGHGHPVAAPGREQGVENGIVDGCVC
ncbi:hypothetical protein DESC_770030 [Desulfosarcina cetonica]|nr:hypothetical protein DESC_770030 [Desulfosarcina cetonica]